MDEQPQFKLDPREMRRQWQQHRQRHYRYRLVARFFIRTAIWLLSVYLVQQWSTRAVPCYLAVSIASALLGYVCGEGDVAHARSGPGRVAAAGEESVVNAEAQNGDREGRAADALAASALFMNDNDRRRGDQGAGEDHSYVEHVPERASPTRANAKEDVAALFDGILTQQQQRTLFLAMQDIGTPGATRCAMDAKFRRVLVHNAIDDMAPCVCGSGARFEACCAPVKKQLLSIVKKS